MLRPWSPQSHIFVGVGTYSVETTSWGSSKQRKKVNIHLVLEPKRQVQPVNNYLFQYHRLWALFVSFCRYWNVQRNRRGTAFALRAWRQGWYSFGVWSLWCVRGDQPYAVVILAHGWELHAELFMYVWGVQVFALGFWVLYQKSGSITSLMTMVPSFRGFANGPSILFSWYCL